MHANYILFHLLQFQEHMFVLRDISSHKRHCNLIANDASGEASKETGVNRDSILNSLSYYHVCNGSLIPDVMHDVLEGSLQYETKLLLQYMINTAHYFTLDDFNMRLENMELGHMEYKDKPTVISQATLHSSNNSLKQKGNSCI